MTLSESLPKQVNVEQKEGSAAAVLPVEGSPLSTPGLNPSLTPVHDGARWWSEEAPLPECDRLVVLVPNQDFSEFWLGKRIWSLVPHYARKKVLLVAQAPDKECQPEAQRRLIYLASIMSDTCFEITTQTSKGRNWINTLKGIVQPGDVIISPKGLAVKSWNHENTPLENRLVEALDMPVYVISGFCLPEEQQKSRKFMFQAFFWMVLIAIFAGGFVLEMDIGQTTTGWVRDVLFCIVLTFEIVLIYSWNAVRG